MTPTAAVRDRRAPPSAPAQPLEGRAPPAGLERDVVVRSDRPGQPARAWTCARAWARAARPRGARARLGESIAPARGLGITLSAVMAPAGRRVALVVGPLAQHRPRATPGHPARGCGRSSRRARPTVREQPRAVGPSAGGILVTPRDALTSPADDGGAGKLTRAAVRHGCPQNGPAARRRPRTPGCSPRGRRTRSSVRHPASYASRVRGRDQFPIAPQQRARTTGSVGIGRVARSPSQPRPSAGFTRDVHTDKHDQQPPGGNHQP